MSPGVQTRGQRAGKEKTDDAGNTMKDVPLPLATNNSKKTSTSTRTSKSMEDSSTKKDGETVRSKKKKKGEMVGAQTKSSLSARSKKSSSSARSKKSSTSARAATESSFCFHPQMTLQDVADQLGCSVKRVIAYILTGESVVCFSASGRRNSLSRRNLLFL